MITKYQKIEWTKETLQLLGTITDKSLAASIGIAALSIRKKRKELGIPKFNLSRVWTKEEIALLGTLTDHALGRKLGLSHNAIYLKRIECAILPKTTYYNWTKETLRLLGTMSDGNLAKKLKISCRAVAYKRNQLKILTRRNVCEAYRSIIEEKFEQRLSIVKIHKDLVENHHFEGSYDSVLHFIKAISNAKVR